MTKSVWEKIGKATLTVLTEVSNAIEEKENEERQQINKGKEAKQTLSQLQEIEKAQEELERRKTALLYKENANLPFFSYNEEKLLEKETRDLEELVYSIYLEKRKLKNRSWETEQVIDEARGLYFSHSFNEERHRMRLVKFLLEHGSI